MRASPRYPLPGWSNAHGRRDASITSVTNVQSPARLCPRCRRPLGASNVRCRFCLLEIRQVRRDEAVTVPALDAELRGHPLRRRTAAALRRVPRPRSFGAWLLLSLTAVVLVLAWNVGSGWVTSPSPLPRPQANEAALASSPGAWAITSGGIDGRRATEASALIDGEVAWERSLGSVVQHQPVADAERLYIAVRDRLLVLDRGTGEQVWEYAAPGLATPPSLAGEHLYLALRSGTVVALDAASGEPAWVTRAADESYTPPLPHAGTLYLHGVTELVGIEAEDGTVLWRRDVEPSRGSLPPVLSGNSLVLDGVSGVSVYDLETGERTFHHPHRSTTGLAVEGDRIFAFSPGFGAAFDVDARLPWWEGIRGFWNRLWLINAAPRPPAHPADWVSAQPPTDAPPSVASSTLYPITVDGGLVIAADSLGLVRAFDASDGSLRWERRFDSIHSPPTATGDGLLLALRDGVVLLDPATGEELRRRDLPPLELRDRRWTVVVDGALFLVDERGGVLALR